MQFFVSSHSPEAVAGCSVESPLLPPGMPNIIHLQNSVNFLQTLGIAGRAKVVKSWLHGWATTHRIKGELRHSCLVGCSDGVDSMSHYLQCPRIYACCRFVCADSPPCPLERFGLLLPSKRNLLLLACTFEAYHALKNEIRSKFDARNIDQIDYHANWLLFARHMGAAAVERLLVRTLFNPMQFESFLDSFLNT